MIRNAEGWCTDLMSAWQAATLTDYASLALAVVVVAWFTGRITSR